MMLWIVVFELALLAAVFMLLPLRAKIDSGSDRDEGAVAVLADQLREVAAEAERGLISEGDARAAEVEIKRRLLALRRKPVAPGRVCTGRDGRWVLWVAALAVPLSAGALYTKLGSPGIPAVAFVERQDERAAQAQISELSGRLLERLQNDPDGGPSDGWMLLGQTYMRMGRYADAASAMENVIGRTDATSAVLSQYAEALVAVDEGIVTPKARDAIRRAREMDPSNPAAAYYEALGLDQAGDSDQAHDLLVSRLEAAAGPAPWMEVFVAQANRIGEAIGRDPVSLSSFAPAADSGAPGPTAGDVAAAAGMSEADRAAFIRSMVDRLAERLTGSPDDLDGWMRLANAYRVLGETGNARDAYGRAEALAQSLPEDDPLKRSVRQALSELKQ